MIILRATSGHNLRLRLSSPFNFCTERRPNQRNGNTSKRNKGPSVFQCARAAAGDTDTEGHRKKNNNYNNNNMASYGTKDLTGKVCLITGASAGIGEAIAHRMVEAGAKVILIARRIAKLEEIKATLESTYPGAKVHCVKFDVKDLDKVRALKLSATVSRARRPTPVSHSPLAPRPLTRF